MFSLAVAGVDSAEAAEDNSVSDSGGIPEDTSLERDFIDIPFALLHEVRGSGECRKRTTIPPPTSSKSNVVRNAAVRNSATELTNGAESGQGRRKL